MKKNESLFLFVLTLSIGLLLSSLGQNIYFALTEPPSVSKEDIARLKKQWEQKGIKLHDAKYWEIQNHK
jgi:hypothetical protein